MRRGGGMVYTGDLKSLEATHAGSSPARGTKEKREYVVLSFFFACPGGT